MNFNANDFRDIDPGERVLLGPGPSNVPARVLQAMSAPCIGHLDPRFLSIMDETQSLLRSLFQTKNAQFAKRRIDGFGKGGFQGNVVRVTVCSTGQLILVQGMLSAVECEFRVSRNTAPVDGSSSTYNFEDTGGGELTA